TDRTRRQWLVTSILLGIALVVVGLALWIGRRGPVAGPSSSAERALEPPSLGAADIDPAVLKVVEAARSTVSQSPHSAEAWGRLGMLFKAHSFVWEANACFVRAGQLDPNDPRWPYHQAIELAERDPEAAVAKLERAALLCGNSPDAPRLRLGE